MSGVESSSLARCAWCRITSWTTSIAVFLSSSPKACTPIEDFDWEHQEDHRYYNLQRLRREVRLVGDGLVHVRADPNVLPSSAPKRVITGNVSPDGGDLLMPRLDCSAAGLLRLRVDQQVLVLMVYSVAEVGHDVPTISTCSNFTRDLLAVAVPTVPSETVDAETTLLALRIQWCESGRIGFLSEVIQWLWIAEVMES